jgi:hypothetical protein
MLWDRVLFEVSFAEAAGKRRYSGKEVDVVL